MRCTRLSPLNIYIRTDQLSMKALNCSRKQSAHRQSTLVAKFGEHTHGAVYAHVCELQLSPCKPTHLRSFDWRAVYSSLPLLRVLEMTCYVARMHRNRLQLSDDVSAWLPNSHVNIDFVEAHPGGIYRDLRSLLRGTVDRVGATAKLSVSSVSAAYVRLYSYSMIIRQVGMTSI